MSYTELNYESRGGSIPVHLIVARVSDLPRQKPSIYRIPARQKQQGHPQQAQAEAVESLGFAGLFRSARWSSSASWSGG